MRYLLDTNILSYADEKNSVFHENVRSAMASLSDSDEVLISVMTLYELEFRISNADEKERLREMVDLAEQCFGLVPVPRTGAKVFGEMKVKYSNFKRITKKEDLMKHNLDFILATTAITEDIILVSNDQIFRDIQEVSPGLQLENWASA